MEIELLLFAGGAVAGLLGALLGLGGGVLIVPLLTLGFGEPLTRAIGTSLVAVVATSAGAAAHNVRTGRADVRLGLTLEIGTVLGAAAGGLLAGFLSERVLAGLFAGLMAYLALSLLRRSLAPADDRDIAEQVDPMAPDGATAPSYRARRLPWALGGSVGAGAASALLGVGGGTVKVPVMRLVMRVPMHVATATSNFMIGVTAAAGAYAYLFRGDIEPMVAAPLALGVLSGASVGARVAPRVNTRWLTVLFVLVAGWVAVEMGLRAAGVAR
ncbi:MAG TPA: sulfite exporter TauE/SafE family protein [Candidatus Binatia bacterium]|nr:sulfite exporter TauE/SafE family protein [Candidatus Binatia bacterium]